MVYGQGVIVSWDTLYTNLTHHGTAFDIAGKWIAEYDSMLEAYKVALAAYIVKINSTKMMQGKQNSLSIPNWLKSTII